MTYVPAVTGNLALATLSGLFFVLLTISSFRERSFRAGAVSLIFLAATTLFWALVILTAPPWLNLTVLVLSGGFAFLGSY